jgi:hypothetical protein
MTTQALAQQLLIERFQTPTYAGRIDPIWECLLFVAKEEAPQTMFSSGIPVAKEGGNSPVPQIDMKRIFALGIDPHTAVTNDLTDAHKHKNIDSPIGLASAMLYHRIDPDLGARCIRHYNTHPDLLDGTTPHEFWRLEGQINPTCPEDFHQDYPDLKPITKSDDNPFKQARTLPLTASMLGWADLAVRRQAFAYVNAATIGNCFLVSAMHGKWEHEVEVATHRLLRADKGPRPVYGQLTQLVRLAGSEFIRRWLKDIEGVRKALGIVRRDATETEMIEGVRQLLKSEHLQGHLLAQFGRPIHPKELKKAMGRSTADLANFLYEAPFSVISELVEDRVTTTAVLASQVGDVNPTKLRLCLVDHDKRPELRDYIGTDTWFKSMKSDMNWIPDTEWFCQRYVRSKALREQVFDVAKQNLYAAFLISLPVFSGENATNMDRALGAESYDPIKIMNIRHELQDHCVQVRQSKRIAD